MQAGPKTLVKGVPPLVLFADVIRRLAMSNAAIVHAISDIALVSLPLYFTINPVSLCRATVVRRATVSGSYHWGVMNGMNAMKERVMNALLLIIIIILLSFVRISVDEIQLRLIIIIIQGFAS
jgi:hypothetical protein